jgi:hypothetical protein
MQKPTVFQEVSPGRIQNSIQISLAREYIRTVRVAFSVVDLLTELGGFALVIFLIFSLFNKMFSTEPLKSYLIEKLYQWQAEVSKPHNQDDAKWFHPDVTDK